MGKDARAGEPERRDFFISYTGVDQQWAEWIAMQLEEAGSTVFLQAWDFRPGSNFVDEMGRAAKAAERTLLVLSSAYLNSDYAFAEWAAAFRRDPRGRKGLLLPVRIEACEVEELLGSIIYIDLVGLEETEARERLLAGIPRARAKPQSVAFPDSRTRPGPSRSAGFPGVSPVIWNVPFPRNPLFTGREDLLARLAEALQPGEAVALSPTQAISGLGGVGKTQLAVEYAYRHKQDYQAVLWTRAESRDALLTGYAQIARVLDLPQKDEPDQRVIVQAVLTWLRSESRWLLILDNADDLSILREVLPFPAAGHLLITTRDQAPGRLAARLEVATLEQDVGALLLLRRAGLLAPADPLETAQPADLALARTISEELGGLPLALDQAGAYIEETACGLEGYQRLYHTRRAELLKRRGGLGDDHPEPVATTWSLSFEQVEQRNPAAAELLRLCAFLAPDAIPEELLSAGAHELGDMLAPVAADAYQLDQAIAALRAYSLLTRDPGVRTLTVHRLVQAVLRDTLPADIQEQWMQRAVQAVSATFPEVEFATWPACERLLPHALLCTAWIEQVFIQSSQAASLLNQAAYYLYDRARYGEAEPLYQRALVIYEQQLGPDHPDTATILNNLAALYDAQGKYEQAEPLYQRALAIDTRVYGSEHLEVVTNLNNLAELYRAQGKYELAEPLYQRALELREQQLGPDHSKTALILNNLALLYDAQDKYELAEQLYQRVLVIYEQQLGPDHPDTAISLNNLAALYDAQGKYEQAESLYQRALAICEQQLGPDHPNTAIGLNNLALMYSAQGKYEQAEPLYQRALAILKQALGPEHPNTQLVRRKYALLLRAMGCGEEARKLEEDW